MTYAHEVTQAKKIKLQKLPRYVNSCELQISYCPKVKPAILTKATQAIIVSITYTTVEWKTWHNHATHHNSSS